MKKQNNDIIGIYKITNPNNEIYIGQSTNIINRKKDYETLKCKKQFKIFNSLKEYGWESHKWEIIEECILEQLHERERYYKIQFIERFGWGKALFYYLDDNNAMGPQSDITKLKKSKVALEKGFGKWNKGKNHSGVGDYLKINSPMIKPIIQYDLQENYIKEYTSVNEAARLFKGVPNVLTGRSKTSGGFKWEYKK
jgi:hypothetical protein